MCVFACPDCLQICFYLRHCKQTVSVRVCVCVCHDMITACPSYVQWQRVCQLRSTVAVDNNMFCTPPNIYPAPSPTRFTPQTVTPYPRKRRESRKLQLSSTQEKRSTLILGSARKFDFQFCSDNSFFCLCNVALEQNNDICSYKLYL